MNINQNSIEIRLEFTPNPDALKYIVDDHVFIEQGAADFTDLTKAESVSPLAASILTIEPIKGCLIGRNFVTITLKNDDDIETTDTSVRKAIQEHIASGSPAVNPEAIKENRHGPTSEFDQQIQEILDQEIRPAVAQDGGDVIFERFEAGVVYLYMQGACAGCPSSTATLKMGIEARLKERIPEITEVVAL